MMSYRYSGRGRSFATRSSFGRQRGPRRASIHPSRYMNVGVVPTAEQLYLVSHQFADFGLHPQLMTNIRHHQYQLPTPIQDQVIPALMQGRDVVGIANTGTGKTAAFLLPLIHKVALDPDQGVLILAPTHELALQIHEEFQIFAAGLPIGA